MSIAEQTPAPTDSGRARIMDEAASLFLRRGYDATSLRQLADVVGMKAGSLYYHFSSKDELLTEILRRGIDVMHQAFDAAEAFAEPDRPANRIGLHVRAHLAALHENGPYTAVHVTTFRTAPDSVRSAVVPLRDSYESRWRSWQIRCRTAIARSARNGECPVAMKYSTEPKLNRSER